MLRSEHHECRAVEGIRSCGVDSDLLVPALYREIHFRAVGFADPVGLHLFHLLRPVQLVQVIQETVRVFCDAQHPLAQVLLCHLRAAALAFTVYNFLICQSGLAGRAPVDREFLLICKARLEHFHEDPLGPFVEIRICRIDFHIPVVKRRYIVDLLLDVGYIFRRGLRRVNAHLDRIVLSRQAECVPAHGMNNVIALLQFITAPHIRDDIASPVSDMKSVS